MNNGLELKGRIALVTGASRGLGRAIAETFAREGALVGVLDLKLSWAQEVADAIVAEGGKALGIGADVSDRTVLRGAIDSFAAEADGLDILVNNAMWNRYEPLEEITADTFSRMAGIGLGGIVWGLQAAVPHMSEGGAIINIGSMAGRLGSSGAIVYSAVKAGVDGLTRAASVELGPRRIRVNAIAPSTVMTDGIRAFMTDEKVAARVSQTPIGRLGEVEDIAQLALWLAGSRATFITGQSLAVDGGIGHAFAR
ncbi:SDR family NAD(P)-dependent oxidoreductase [Cupriavidus taiwanensis]|uniref:SDR family NAD(P)-dependent oxidoreductase n=1 Tax=Cupriavidus taiwanensis TaxID=164546 RepID=UPI000E2F88AE|nr:SDR family NAD(P)-dependent oxidoreductase [Cupriavidus taiwanensis]